MVLKGMNWVHNTKIKKYTIESSQLGTQCKIRSDDLERSQLGTQCKDQITWP